MAVIPSFVSETLIRGPAHIAGYGPRNKAEELGLRTPSRMTCRRFDAMPARSRITEVECAEPTVMAQDDLISGSE
jgi:hypothetical protein